MSKPHTGLTPQRLSERDWQARVMAAARHHGWLCTHIPLAPATIGGRRFTSYTGDDGLPDLILARAGTVLLRELKTNTGHVSEPQQRWVAAGAQVWRPKDWLRVLAELKGHHT